MKYLYLLTALIFMGCSDKSASVQKTVETKAEVVVTEVKKVLIPEPVVEEVVKQEVVVSEPRQNVTMVEEETVMKKIGSDVPTSCAMWSDGSNICTRASAGKASCTTNPVENRMFSCLQWQ